MAWTNEMDATLVARSSRPNGPVLIVPTASAPEGDAAFDRWGKLGLDHFKHLGISASVLAVKSKADANNQSLMESIQEASLVYFSGGNPAYLAETLRDSYLWSILKQEVAAGMSLAGSSAGINYLGAIAFDSSLARFDSSVFKPGLYYIQDTVLCPHWDTIDRFIPGASKFILDTLSPKYQIITVDEDTALLGNEAGYTVVGEGEVNIHSNGQSRKYEPGNNLSIDGFGGPTH